MNHNHKLPPSGFTFICTLSDEQGVGYIGKTSNLGKRFKKHLTEAKLKRSIREKWLHSRIVAGAPIFIELLDTVPVDDWVPHEIYWIAQFRAWGFDLVNGTDGGEGSNGFKGRRHTQETKEKIAQKRALQVPTSRRGIPNGVEKLTPAQVQ